MRQWLNYVELSDAIGLTWKNSSYNLSSFSQVSGVYINLRTVFNVNYSHFVYLFHLGNSWMIGYDYRSTDAIARSIDMALRPELIIMVGTCIKK